MDGIALLTIFVLSVFVGFEVVSKVSTVLHTPLMSGANASIRPASGPRQPWLPDRRSRTVPW